ncbi:MAG TPA: hypothetical protein VJ914_07685 [Pseudonocardiaceae bacterium]|nr:hypothetical protein [Pseudonocardiaceae bacterium]
MTGYLLDTSAIWRLFRLGIRAGIWRSASMRANSGRVPLFRYESRAPDEIAGHLDALCDLAPVPKSAWRWVDTAQYKLTQRGQYFAAVARVLPDLSERDIRH